MALTLMEQNQAPRTDSTTVRRHH